MANYTTLTDLFIAIANAIRTKKNSTETIIADTFPTEIDNLRTGFDYNNQNVTSIPDYAFYGCEDLNSVDCYNLTSVGASAFENCTNLKSVILYDGVENVGENAFKGCSNITIYCMFDAQPDTWNENWNVDGCEVVWLGGAVGTWDISATEDDNVTAKLYNNGQNEGMYSLVISGNGNMINYGFFDSNKSPWSNYQTNLISAIICDGITNIGSCTFHNATNLSSVTISNSVTNIGDKAFYRCMPLANVVIPDGVTNIGTEAFYFCKSLTSITIPNNVTSIGINAFQYCDSLTDVYITDLTSWCSIAFGNDSSNPLNYAHSLYLNKQLVTNLVIPDSVTSIGSSAFCGYLSLVSVTIPDSVTSIGSSAFYDCSSLVSVTIPDSVTSIGSSAFCGCLSLESIIIPDGVIFINNRTFAYCRSLTSITIPNSVTRIFEEAFGGVASNYIYPSLSIVYTGTIAQWNEIVLDNSWIYYERPYTIHCTDGDIAENGTITYHSA